MPERVQGRLRELLGEVPGHRSPLGRRFIPSILALTLGGVLCGPKGLAALRNTALTLLRR